MEALGGIFEALGGVLDVSRRLSVHLGRLLDGLAAGWEGRELR